MFGREAALAHSILDWARKRLGSPWKSVAFALEGECDHYANHFTTSCALHVVPFQGRPASAWYQEVHAHLSAMEREFLASARAAWTSVWEVRELGESSALLVDRLTGEERRATLHPGQDWLEVGTPRIGTASMPSRNDWRRGQS